MSDDAIPARNYVVNAGHKNVDLKLSERTYRCENSRGISHKHEFERGEGVQSDGIITQLCICTDGLVEN